MEKANSSIIRDEKKSAVLEAEEKSDKSDSRPKVKDINTQQASQERPGPQVPGAAAPGKPAGPATPGGAAPEGILLNFDNADIFEVIQVIAGALNINYIIDPQVKGVVNIHSGSKIPPDQLLAVFKKILHINGLDIRNEGDYEYIYAAKKLGNESVNSPDKIGELKDSSQFIIQVLPLAYLASGEVIKLVEPYLSAQGAIYNLPTQNTLLISDFQSKVVDILRIINRIDISPLASLKIKLVRVDNAPLFDLNDELLEIFTALKMNSKEFDSITVVPLERVNSLMLIGADEAQIQNGVDWIKELDVVPSQDRDNIYIYNVRNSVASELSELINELLTQEQPAAQKTTGTKTTSAPGMSPDDRGSRDSKSSRSTRSNTSRSRTSLTGGTAMAATPATAGAGGVAKALPSLRFVGEPVVFADDDRNVILIRSLPADYTRIVKLLERLDNLPRQVLVEVLVAEIELKNELEFGIEWFLTKNKYSFGTEFSAVGKPAAGNASGFSYTFTAGDVEGFLQTLASRSNFAILSSPQILVLNNEKASVNVGKQVPIVTTVTENATTVSQVDKTVQYMDTGVILDVTPQINYNGVILLEVSQTVSKAQENTTSDISSPEISKREIQTKLAVKNGQSILMGGMIDKNTSTVSNGVPFLMDIPVFGNLFKYQKDSTTKTELIVMITPYVIESEDVLDQYARDFQDKMSQLRPTLHESLKASPREKW
ncbi:MAG: type II secretion system secretin GspD [Deltaproteobacteria bacterium]|nr:type II secretion system secretin GspD [Deltaproteobacteria bacterium]